MLWSPVRPRQRLIKLGQLVQRVGDHRVAGPHDTGLRDNRNSPPTSVWTESPHPSTHPHQLSTRTAAAYGEGEGRRAKGGPGGSNMSLTLTREDWWRCGASDEKVGSVAPVISSLKSVSRCDACTCMETTSS